MTQQVESVDILIVGAGLIGSSVAWHAARLGGGRVRAIDFDLEGSLSSSEMNAGGVRATLNQPINIQMSQHTIDYLESVAEDVGYRACGYLWLQSPEKFPGALKAREQQQAMGWEVQSWDVSELRRRVPFLDKTDGIAGALFAPRDGLVNPNLLKGHFRARARETGDIFAASTQLTAVPPAGGGPARVLCERLERQPTSEEKLEVLTGRGNSVPSRKLEYRAERVVNCAGPWAGEAARRLGYESPVHATRRQVSIFDCRDVDLTPYGMIIDTTGVYFHPEAMNGLGGYCDHGEPRGINYHYDSEAFFMERIWPALYERSSAFERLKHLTGWAGQYEVSPDDSAIIGRVEAGDAGRSGRVLEAHSFSGHGVMHSHTAGVVLAELMAKGRFETLDAAELAGSRFAAGKLVRETAVI